MTFNVLNDLATLTTIPQATLVKLMDKMGWCICNLVEESSLNSDSITEIDLGIGKLILNIENNEIEYKFIPSTKLESNIIKTIKEKKNPLLNKLETSLADRIINTYKDMI